MPKNRHVVPLAIIAVIIAAVTIAQALLIDWLPVSASEQADRVDGLFWFLFISSAVIFVIVVTVLVYSVWRFRAAPDDESDGPPVHGNTMLEIVWTAIPAVLLVVTAIYAYVVMNKNEATAQDRLQIDVYAEQFDWSFGYADLGVQSGDLRLPVGRQVQLNLRARDVIHDFWVPNWGLKGDAVPGIVHRIYYNPNKVGTYPIICAELCGAGHAVMRARAIVMPQAEYAAWEQKARLIAQRAQTTAGGSGGGSTGDGDAAAGKTFFQATCEGCHPSGGSAAGAGPKLAAAGLTAQRVSDQVVNGGAVMPPGLASGQDLANVVAYVVSIQ